MGLKSIIINIVRCKKIVRIRPIMGLKSWRIFCGWRLCVVWNQIYDGIEINMQTSTVKSSQNRIRFRMELKLDKKEK